MVTFDVLVMAFLPWFSVTFWQVMESSLQMLPVWVKLSLENYFEHVERFLQVEEPKKLRNIKNL